MAEKRFQYSLKELPFDKRMDMLKEAEDTFKDAAHELPDMRDLLLKSAAISGTRESVLFRMKTKWIEKMTDQDIKDVVWLILWTDFSSLLKSKWAELMEEFYFYGGIGLAIGILKGDKHQIEWYEKIKKILSTKE